MTQQIISTGQELITEIGANTYTFLSFKYSTFIYLVDWIFNIRFYTEIEAWCCTKNSKIHSNEYDPEGDSMWMVTSKMCKAQSEC